MAESERPDDTSSSGKDAGRNSDNRADERKNSIAQVSRNREWEEQERRIREQKLGLHPLQVLRDCITQGNKQSLMVFKEDASGFFFRLLTLLEPCSYPFVTVLSAGQWVMRCKLKTTLALFFFH